jgi:predicted RNase H-like nuclease (RuvC/YqgF family)
MTKLTAKDTVLDTNKELQKQMQATIDGLTLTVETIKRTISELTNTEKANELTIQTLRQKLQATIDGQRNTEEANNQTIQQLLEKNKQCQATIDGKTKTEEAMEPAVQLPCGQQKDVSTRKVEAIANSKWAEILPAINIANFRPNNVRL